jgi:hypothetical protein
MWTLFRARRNRVETRVELPTPQSQKPVFEEPIGDNYEKSLVW